MNKRKGKKRKNGMIVSLVTERKLVKEREELLFVFVFLKKRRKKKRKSI